MTEISAEVLSQHHENEEKEYKAEDAAFNVIVDDEQSLLSFFDKKLKVSYGDSFCSKKTVSFRPDDRLLGKVITQKNKHKKQILRRAKLTLAKPLDRKYNEQHKNNKCGSKCDELNLSDDFESDVISSSSNNNELIQSCSQEYLSNSSDQVSYNESNPDELAAYLEQMLHIPKPMSLMAELMYA